MKTANRCGDHGAWVKWLLVLCAMVVLTTTPESRGAAVQVSSGQSVTMTAENVAKLAVADPNIADVIPLSDKEISIIGKKPGVTTLTIVHTEATPTESHRVEVSNDSAISTIRLMIGQPGITVRSIGDTLVLDGQVENELQADRAAQVAGAYGKVLNLLEVTKPRQIKIRTRVVEVSTDAVKRLGIQYFGPAGQVKYGYGRVSVSEGSGEDSAIHGFLDPTQIGNQTISGGTVGLEATLNLLLTKNYGRVLSEPTLYTMSGKEASFLVGQEVPIFQQLPNSFTVEFKEVGVRMKVKPVADSQNRINTTIHSEVSQIVRFARGTFGEVPIIGTKKADTQLQLNDGQTLVIGGLIENNLSRDALRKVPWLGDIPLLGALFRLKENDQNQGEVLFFLTPEIVKNIDAETKGAARSPVMKQWNDEEATQDFLDLPKDHELMPEGEKPLVTPATEKPAAATPAPEPKTNYSPARPAGP